MKFPNIAHKALITVLDLPLQISVIQTLLPNGHHAFPDQGPSHMRFPQLEQQSPPFTQPLKSATIYMFPKHPVLIPPQCLQQTYIASSHSSSKSWFGIQITDESIQELLVWEGLWHFKMVYNENLVLVDKRNYVPPQGVSKLRFRNIPVCFNSPLMLSEN